MALVELARFDNRIEGEIVRGKLAAEDIPALLFDDGLASLGIGSLTPVRLMVDEEDEAIAQRVLRS